MTENKNIINALLVEDDEEDILLMKRMVRDSEGIRIHLDVATSLGEGLDRLKRGTIDIVLLDLGLPDSQGLDTFRRLHKAEPCVPIVLMSGLDDESAALDAVQSGAQDYLIKGKVNGTLVRHAIHYAMERHRLQQQLLDMQRREHEVHIDKLKSLGVLAGGIAHDFNNLLMGIVGNICLAKERCAPDGDIRELLDEAEKASISATSLTRQLLTFAKGEKPLRTVTSIVDLLRDAVSFTLRGSNVGIQFTLPDGSVFADVDPGQIEQVFRNIVINADQAMPEGGAINIRVEILLPDADPAIGLRREKYVRISFEDNGSGIPAHQISRIFDPYFTTKQMGSGLGLATAYSIVKKHSGTIRVESALEEGTTFHVYLPVWEGEPQRQEPERGRDVLSKGGRILVMDDEECVRTLTGKYLQGLGFEATLVTNGSDALAAYKDAREEGRSFDAVIADLTVPGGMGGKDLVRKLIEMDADVLAIVSSGYSDDPIIANPRDYGFRGVVLKPYRIEELGIVLSSVLLEAQQKD